MSQLRTASLRALPLLALALPAVAQNGVSNPGLRAKAPTQPPTYSAATSSLFFSEDWSGVLYTLDTSTGAATAIGSSGVTSATVGLAPRTDTTMYGTIWADTVITECDGSGATYFGDAAAEGLAYDATTDTLYGAINGAFFEIDTTTGNVGASLAAAPGDIEGIAFGHGGVFGLEGWAGSDTRLWFYDPSTNSWSVVGDTGIDWNLVGLAYDPGGDVLYAKGSQDSFLYRIDPSNGATSMIGDTGRVDGGGLAWLGPGGDYIGTSYCGPANLNSSGQAAIITAFGSTDASANNVRLDAAQMATNQFGYFINSMTQGFTQPPGSQGNLCVGGAIGRHTTAVMSTGAAGEFSLQLDLTDIPTPGGPVSINAGESWYWQAWFRDANPGNTSNFTDGVCITFN